MKLLSFQETNFLLNPEKFNRNYQYLLTHRIKTKMKDVNRDIDFIKRHEKALLTDRKKIIYDDDQDRKKFVAEREAESKKMGRIYFTPNFKTTIRDVDYRLTKLVRIMRPLEKYLTFDKFIQKHKTMDQKGKLFLDNHLKGLQDKLQQNADKIGSLRKNLMEGYMVTNNDFEKWLPKDLKKWDYSELD